MSKIPESEVKSPCIRACEYDDDNLCIACLRTKKEIFEWGDYSDEEKLSIMKRILKKQE